MRNLFLLLVFVFAAMAISAGANTEMVFVPAGSFLMGNNGSEGYSHPNELPQHWAHLSDYYIGKYQVTRGEYRKFMEAGGYYNPNYWSTEGWNWKTTNNISQPDSWDAYQDWGTGAFLQTDSHPVIGTSYYEAEAYCNWAGGYLPTEAQWEKAARWTGNHANVYPWGDMWDNDKCNNYWDSNFAAGGFMMMQTAPVGSYPAGVSPYGCHDMAGNISEWCRDWYDENYYSETPPGGWVDPQGPAIGTEKVVRGGSWLFDAEYCRAAIRVNLGPTVGAPFFGFRMAKDAEAEVTPVGEIKLVADGTQVHFAGAIVVANQPLVRDGFYVETADRSAGIRVVTTLPVSVGDEVKVVGTASTVQGERVVIASGVTVLSSGNTLPEPLAMNGKAMLADPDSIGKIVKLTGQMRNTNLSSAPWFYLDDPSDVVVRCQLAEGFTVPMWSLVTVTGVVSTELEDGEMSAVLLIDKTSDIQQP